MSGIVRAASQCGYGVSYPEWRVERSMFTKDNNKAKKAALEELLD